ncbi:MAG: hypothetical protein WBL35_00480, partial [Ornithinibacter sp.]
MRQTNPGCVCTGVTENPAIDRAWSPEEGSPEVHLVLMLLPVSTMTVTPEVPEHAAALAGAASSTPPATARA